MRNLKAITLAMLLILPMIAPVLAYPVYDAPNYDAENNAVRAGNADQFIAPVSAKPKEWVHTSNFGEIITADSIVLTGTLLTDDLPPFVYAPRDQVDADPDDADYPSGFPWSKEMVSFEITKFGEVPSTYVGTEHVKSQVPIQGEIFEIWFIGSTLGHPNQERNDDGLWDFPRYLWATYSRPGDFASIGEWQTAAGSYNPFTGGTFNDCEQLYDAYGPDIDVGPWPGDFTLADPAHGDVLAGSWVGCLIPDSFKLLVNSTRVAIVKVDMHAEFRAPDGSRIDTIQNFFNFQINKTFVFYKDKKYIKELKNIKVTLHKDVAEKLKIQWMQVKEFDLDWGESQQFFMDNAFIQNFIGWTQVSQDWQGLDSEFLPDMQKWPGDYSLAIVEPDEVSSVREHTGWWAFYPVVSNYHVNFVERTRTPWPNPVLGTPGASNDNRVGSRLDGRNLIMGAWNFTMLSGDNFHFASVEGVVEEEFTKPNDVDFPDPSGMSESLFELVWALDEVFNPLFTLNKIGDQFAESDSPILDGFRDDYGYWWPFIGPGYSGDDTHDSRAQIDPNKPYDGWPWWDAQRLSWENGYWYNLGIFVVGDTVQTSRGYAGAGFGFDGGHWPGFSAQTADNTAAVDVAQVFDRYVVGQVTVDGPYRSALDTEAIFTPVAANTFAGRGAALYGGAGVLSERDYPLISLHRWYYVYDLGTDTWHEKPVKISSIGPFVYPYQYWASSGPDCVAGAPCDGVVDFDSFPPWNNGHGYLYPYFDQEGLEDKFNVWHTLTFGGPGVNMVTNYFNDFSSSLFLISDTDMPDWWSNPTWINGKFIDDGYTDRTTHQFISESVIYSPASKRVYKDYKEADDAEHYFALVSVVMDHNITREYFEDPTYNPFQQTYPWAAFIVAGLRAEGTRMAGSYVAHAFQAWFLLNTMNIGLGANPGGFLENGIPGTDSYEFGWGGATFMILEFIDIDQDGHVDKVSVVEVGDDIVSDKTIIPCIWYIDWQGAPVDTFAKLDVLVGTDPASVIKVEFPTGNYTYTYQGEVIAFDFNGGSIDPAKGEFIVPLWGSDLKLSRYVTDTYDYIYFTDDFKCLDGPDGRNTYGPLVDLTP